VSVRVLIPSHLRSYTGGAEVQATGATLRALLRDLDARHPGFYFRVIDEQDRVRRHMILFVGGERRDDLATAVADGAEVQIVAALSGG
jgi:molybdopterin synthase sulfur carrier subunit